MAKTLAVMTVCDGVINDGTGGHSMRDNCWGCAPYWEQYPVCPTHKTKVAKTGYCQTCKKFYAIPEQLDLSAHRGCK